MMNIFFGLFIFTVFEEAFSVYFHMQANDRKCFIEEIPEDTIVMGDYKAETLNPQTNQFYLNQDNGIQVEVSNPQGTIILSKLYTLEGKFTFTSEQPGEHQICIHPAKTIGGYMTDILRIHLTFGSGEHIMDYRKLAEENKFNELQLRVRQLLDQVEKMQKEQNYQRTREEQFRQSSESTNKNVLWWAFGQLLLVVGISTWQFQHLKWFFRVKKIV